MIAPPNISILGCKPHWFAKKKKKSCEKWLLGGVKLFARCKKASQKNFTKFTEKYLC